MMPFVITEHEGIMVVRDDLIQGGTKVRALPVLFNGSEEYVYASPVFGYAQIALAHAAAAHGKRATVFCARRKEKHPRTKQAEDAGAKIVEVACGYMSVVRARAVVYCGQTGVKLLPFGLDDATFIAALADLAAGAVQETPKEVWCVAGSGVLCRALQQAWPAADVNAVRVGVAPDCGNARMWTAPEKFEQDAKLNPPFPSCSNYDAKAWQFIRLHASPGALFWNVAA